MQGILGGTFDPPHNAHLAIADAARAELGIEAIRLVPARDPWQKAQQTVSSPEHRWAMTELLASERDYLVADDVEMRRSGPTYSIDTIEQMGESVVLILGADAALGLPSWHRSAELLKLVDLAVVPRPGITVGEVERAVNRPVTWLSMEPIDLSSTAIRSQARAGERIDHLVPESIAKYVAEHDLYTSGESRRRQPLSSHPMTTDAPTASQPAIDSALIAASAIDAKSGENVALLDLSGLLVITDVFIIASGTSRRHVLTLADEAALALKESGRLPLRKEGTDHGKWVLLDYGDIVIHVFDRETREYYDLERLWADAPRLDFTPESVAVSD